MEKGHEGSHRTARNSLISVSFNKKKDWGDNVFKSMLSVFFICLFSKRRWQRRESKGFLSGEKNKKLKFQSNALKRDILWPTNSASLSGTERERGWWHPPYTVVVSSVTHALFGTTASPPEQIQLHASYTYPLSTGLIVCNVLWQFLYQSLRVTSHKRRGTGRQSNTSHETQRFTL